MTNSSKSVSDVLRDWLPFAIITLIFGGLVYAAVQQNYRMSANDPQVQYAQDIATAINEGNATPDAIVSPTPAQDMTKSLAMFVSIYSATGTPIGSSVGLDGQIATPPSGVFDEANSNGENRFTWEPKEGVRVAAVVSKFDGAQPGFVLVGRSLKEVENRERQLLIMTSIATLASLVLSFLAMLLLARRKGGAVTAGAPVPPTAGSSAPHQPHHEAHPQKHEEK